LESKFISRLIYGLENAAHQKKQVLALAGRLLTNISGKTGSLTRILEDLLPSCAVVTDVTPAAVAGLNTVAIPLLDTQTRLNDLREGIPFDPKCRLRTFVGPSRLS
jgi:hypothetical protein